MRINDDGSRVPMDTMFQITVKTASKTPVREYMHIVGVDAKGEAKIGDKITDGTNTYEVVSIPFVRRRRTRAIDEVDICIPATDEKHIGKTLYST